MSTQPNIIVIMTDDQRWDTVTPLAMPFVYDRFQQGIRFVNAFTTTALCCPSRMNFLTGNLASVHGIHTNDGELSVGPDQDTLATRLHTAGYRTGLFGKYVNNYNRLGPPNVAQWHVPPGWDSWAAIALPVNAYLNYTLVTGPTATQSYGDAASDYLTDVLRDRAAVFIDQALQDNVPFFAFVTPFAPHTATADQMVATRHAGTFASLPPWRPPSHAEADVSDKGSLMQIPIVPGKISTTDGYRILQYEALLAVDEMVEELFHILIRHEALDQTIVVYLSEQGLFWYEHRLTGKNMPYDEAHRIPLLIRYPAALGSVGRSETGLATIQDVSATLAEWGGALPLGVGASMVASLTAGQALPRVSIPLEGWNADNTSLYSGVRTANNKLFTWSVTQEIEEYNLVTDSYEMSSLQ